MQFDKDLFTSLHPNFFEQDYVKNMDSDEVFEDLRVKVVSVGDYEEAEVSFYFSLHFSGEEYHGEAFSASLGVPEYTEFSAKFFSVFDGFDEVVDA